MSLADGKLRFIHPDDLSYVWELIRPGLLACKRYSTDEDWLPEDIYASIKSNTVTLHLGETEGGDYLGFIILMPLKVWGMPVLHIWCCYNASRIDLFRAFDADLVRCARAIGATKIKFQSPRRGWARRLAAFGFVPTQVTYMRRL